MAATTQLPIQPYMTRLDKASQIRAGDFLDWVDPQPSLRGPRGGRYRYEGQKVQSKVTSVAWLLPGPAGMEEIDASDGWQPLRAAGFRIKTRQGQVTLPGNLADLTSAVVRRKEEQQ